MRQCRQSMRGLAVWALLLAVILCPPVPAVAQTTTPREGVANFLLENGMEVVVIPDRRAPIVTHMVWYRAGSADEPPGKSGIAHFFEHLMFKGTRNHGPGEFDAAIAEIGGSQNAFTSYDYTAYYQTVSPDALPQMMALEADRMRNLVIDDSVVATERDVVLEERRSRIEGDPESLLSEEVQATLYQNHPYRVPVIGWMHEMEKLNREDAAAFYDRYYAPNNAILVVAGDVTAEQVKTLAESTYGKVARGPDLPPRLRPTEPEQNTSRSITMTDARVSIPSFARYWLAPSYRTAEPGEAEALDLLSEILGGGSRSRLYQELVVKRQIAAGSGAFYDGDMLDESSIAVYGSPRGAGGLKELEAAVDAEVARIRRDGVTPDELHRAKNRLVRATVFAQDSASSMANMYGAALATGNSVEDVQEWPERVKSVTPEQVKAAAQKYLDPRSAVTAYLLPEPETPN